MDHWSDGRNRYLVVHESSRKVAKKYPVSPAALSIVASSKEHPRGAHEAKIHRSEFKHSSLAILDGFVGSL